MFMNEQNNNNNAQVASAPLVPAVTSSKMSAEEKAKREAARQANLDLLKPFITQAMGIVANQMGIDASAVEKLYNMGLKEVQGKVHAAAREFLPKSERTVSNGGPTPKWIGKTVDQLRRTLGFAASHKIKDDMFAECLKKALELGAIVPVSKKPVVAAPDAQ